MNTTQERKSKKLPAYLNEEEFVRIIKAVKNQKHRLAIMLAYNCGLRISEVVKLKPGDIDFNSKRIFIREGKFKKDRVVPLPKGFPQSYIKLLPLQFKNVDSGIRAIQYAFSKALKKSGVNKPGIHFHSLRHSFAVQAMEKGIPLNAIQVILGHEDISTTGIYLKINPADALKSYEELW